GLGRWAPSIFASPPRGRLLTGAQSNVRIGQIDRIGQGSDVLRFAALLRRQHPIVGMREKVRWQHPVANTRKEGGVLQLAHMQLHILDVLPEYRRGWTPDRVIPHDL